MSQSEALYELWNNEPDGCFWMVHTIQVFSKEEIECMRFKQLEWLFNKMIAYEESIDYNNKITHELVDGFKILKKCLREKEIKYYNDILYTKYSRSSMTAKDIGRCFITEEEVKKTYKEIYDKAAMKIRKDYQTQNKINYLELKKITDEINLKELYEQRKKKLEAINELSANDKYKYYQDIRLVRNAESEKKRKELGVLRLKEWKETDPEGYAESHRQSVKKYQKKQKDLTTCETTEELAAKVVKIAIAKALKSIYNANYHKLKQELKVS